MLIDEVKNNWQEVIEKATVTHGISSVSCKTWLEPLEPIAAEEVSGRIIITILVHKEELSLNYIENKYRFILQDAVKSIFQKDCEIRLVISADNGQIKPNTKPAPIISSSSNLNPSFTFESFVVGNSNNVAHAASLAVAESPGEIYNPLFIYGGVGLGKTHLMQAIALFALQNNSSLKVIYTSCENFTNELIDAIRNKNNFSTTEFREKYRNVDILLIDDIQFLSNRESTQEEIFNTFNSLYESGKQIVFASDRPPGEIENIHERIRSRFLSGLTVDISAPDFETRMAILRKKEEREGYNIDNEVITYVASNITSNIRELEGALRKIDAYSKLNNNCEINISFAEEVLKDNFLNQNKEITPEKIREIVADHFGIKVDDLASEKRNKDLAHPRQIAMYLCCDMTKVSLTHVARTLGKKDHSTVIHGRDKIIEELNKNESLQKTIDILKKKITGA